jgi:hypothetical protein
MNKGVVMKLSAGAVRVLCVLAVVLLPARAWAGEEQGTIGTVGLGGSKSAAAITATWPGPDGLGYVGQAEPYSWVELSTTGNSLYLSDDESSDVISIGFPFPFYDMTPTELFISSNGFLSFGQGSADRTPDCALPSAQAPNDIIALMWDDLDPGDTSDPVYYQSFPSGGCPWGGYSRGCFVVQYEDFCHYPGGASCVTAGTFEAILLENGDIVMQFKDAGDEQGAMSTTGIEGHDAGADHGLTYACNAPGSLTNSLAIRFLASTGLHLTPSELHSVGCPGFPQEHALNLINRTGLTQTFAMSYDVVSGDGSLVGPPSLTVADGAIETFVVELTPESYLQSGPVVTAVTVTGSSDADVAVLTSEIATHFLESIPGSAPSWAGDGLPVDGCTAVDASGHWVTYLLGDGIHVGFAGFWAYDHDANTWFQPVASNTPTDRFAPEWAYDPDSNLCYLSGGSSDGSGLGDIQAVLRFDPVANAFAPLPDLGTARAHHASWVATIDGARMLCVGGGTEVTAWWLSSTECYDLDVSPAAWEPENATLGALPDPWWGMADGVNRSLGVDQLWLADGTTGGNTTDEAIYWDDADNQWHSGGNTGFPRYRLEGEFFQGRFYVLGGKDPWFGESATVASAIFDGSTWQWESLPDLPNRRSDDVVGVAGDSLRVVDGFGLATSDYVDAWQPCPPSPSSGWLEGMIIDAETPTPAPVCAPASLTIQPPGLTYWSDPGTGHYGEIEVHEGNPQVFVGAFGYAPLDPVTVSIVAGIVTTQDFHLERPVVDLPWNSFHAVAPVGSVTVGSLSIANAGHQPLTWTLTEPTPLPWLTEDPAAGTIPPLGNMEIGLELSCGAAGTSSGMLWLEHDDPCEPPMEIAIELHCVDDLMFYDGFEDATTNAWSSTVP